MTNDTKQYLKNLADGNSLMAINQILKEKCGITNFFSNKIDLEYFVGQKEIFISEKDKTVLDKLFTCVDRGERDKHV